MKQPKYFLFGFNHKMSQKPVLMFLTILNSYEQNIHSKKHTPNKKHFLFLCHLKAQIQNPLEKLSENMPGLSK